MENKPELTIKTYNRLWQQNNRLREREERLKNIIIEIMNQTNQAWKILGSKPNKFK